MFVNLLFPISNANTEDIDLRQMTPDNKRKVLLIFAGFLVPAVIFLLVSKFVWSCKLLVVLPAVLCYFCGTLLMFLPARDNIKLALHESASAAIYPLDLCYSISSFYYFLLPQEKGNSLKEFLGVYLDFMIWSFIFILIGYRIHYRKNRLGTKDAKDNSGINWNLITAFGIAGCSLFLKLFNEDKKYAVARAIIFVGIMLTFLMLSVGIFEFRKTQFYYKSNPNK